MPEDVKTAEPSLQIVKEPEVFNLSSYRKTADDPVKPPSPEKPEEKKAEALTPVAEEVKTEPEPGTGEEFEELPDAADKAGRSKAWAKLRAERAQFKAEADLLKRQMAESSKPAPAPEKPAERQALPPDPRDPEPTEDKFETYRDFTKALASWQYRQDKRADQIAVSRQSQLAKTQTLSQQWDEREAAVSKEIRGYSEAFNAFIGAKPAPPIAQAVLESENGPRLAHYLGSKPEELKRVLALSPTAAIRELGKIEAKLEAKTPPAIIETKTPQAPPDPIKPISGGSADSGKLKVTDSLRDYRRKAEAGATF